MNKIKEFLNKYPAYEFFGIAGLIIMFVLSTIFSKEIEDFWINIKTTIFCTGTKETTPPKQTNKNLPSATPESSEDTESGDNDSTSEEIPFDGNILNGTLVKEDSRTELYIPTITGIYRFDFEIDSVKKDYVFYIMNSAEEELAKGYYSSSDPAGITVTLESGLKYTLVVESVESEEYEEVEYEININSPDNVLDVKDNNIKGKVRYIDQEIEYKYTAPKSGIYRFDFDINDVNQNYGFYVFGEKEDMLINTSYDSEGATYELEKGKQYTVFVTQKQEFPEYDISIGVPNDVKTVKENKIKGEIRYIDQINRYYFTAPKTGTFKFKLGINDVNYNYQFCILSKKNEVLVKRDFDDEEITLELKKGERYEIQIQQYSGFPKYSVHIGIVN